MAKRKKAVRRRRRALGGLGASAADHGALMKSAFERVERELAAMKAAGDKCPLVFDRYDKARWALSAAEEHRMSGNIEGRWVDHGDDLKYKLEKAFFNKCKVIARGNR